MWNPHRNRANPIIVLRASTIIVCVVHIVNVMLAIRDFTPLYTTVYPICTLLFNRQCVAQSSSSTTIKPLTLLWVSKAMEFLLAAGSYLTNKCEGCSRTYNKDPNILQTLRPRCDTSHRSTLLRTNLHFQHCWKPLARQAGR